MCECVCVCVCVYTLFSRVDNRLQRAEILNSRPSRLISDVFPTLCMTETVTLVMTLYMKHVCLQEGQLERMQDLQCGM